MCAMMAAIMMTPTTACAYCAHCMPLMSAAENGNSMMMPDTERAIPPQNDGPENDFLAGVEPMRRGMMVTEDAAPFFEPADIGSVGDVVPDPEDEDHQDAQHERPSQEVVGELGVLRPSREGVGPNQRHQQALTEDVVQPADRQDDEGDRGHPVREAFQTVESEDLSA